MISKVELNKTNSSNNQLTTPKNKRNSANVEFKGLGGAVLKGIQVCEAHPMLNVSVLDFTTAIGPRTFFETFIGSKQKDENGNDKRKLNIFGGFEAFRRESSGLLINCLVPSFIVIGVAKLFNKYVMGRFNKSNLTTSWANSEVIEKIQKYRKIATGSSDKEKIYNTLYGMISEISGVDGHDIKSFEKILNSGENREEFTNLLNKTAEDIANSSAQSAKSGNLWLRIKTAFGLNNQHYTDELYKFVVKKTKIAENIKFNGDKGYSTSSLKHVFDSAEEVISGAVKENIFNNDVEFGRYLSKAKKLVNVKSAVGLLGIIIPLAVSAQPINRWITHKLSGRIGAPIYNDDQERELTPAEKKKLTAQKFFAVPLMWGVAGLSMLMDRPSLKMFQFKNIFPTMDQARIISAMTFSSRIAASEDSNELKENTIRDIATFSSFYFLGDYAAKAIASLIQKFNKNVTLINTLKEVDPDAGIMKKLWYWAKHTNLKSFEELEAISDKGLKSQSKTLRAVCHLGNLAFSLVSLGVFIPLYTRTQTNKKKQMQMEKLAKIQQSGSPETYLSKSPAFSSFSLVQNKKV